MPFTPMLDYVTLDGINLGGELERMNPELDKILSSITDWSYIKHNKHGVPVFDSEWMQGLNDRERLFVADMIRKLGHTFDERDEEAMEFALLEEKKKQEQIRVDEERVRIELEKKLDARGRDRVISKLQGPGEYQIFDSNQLLIGKMLVRKDEAGELYDETVWMPGKRSRDAYSVEKEVEIKLGEGGLQERDPEEMIWTEFPATSAVFMCPRCAAFVPRNGPKIDGRIPKEAHEHYHKTILCDWFLEE